MMSTDIQHNHGQHGHYSLLSDKAILRYKDEGNIVIKPFNIKNLSTSSYDVTLGHHYYRESTPEPGKGIYNPYFKNEVERIWGNSLKAELVSHWRERTGLSLENIKDENYIIWISPGETILAHTNEFIGGRNTVTTMMKARSSMGRNFIEVCKCAGWGDVGYVNRWTMEITNNSRYYSIPLVVGRRIGQIVFFDTEGILDASYESTGKYQNDSDLESIISNWKPENMLPRMYLDREIRE